MHFPFTTALLQDVRRHTRWLMWNKLRVQFCVTALLVHSCAIFPSWAQATLFALSFFPLGHPSTVPAEQRTEQAPHLAVLFQGVDIVQGCSQLHTPLWAAALLFPMAAAHLKQSQITTSSLISCYYFLQESQHKTKGTIPNTGGVSEHQEIFHYEGDPGMGCPEFCGVSVPRDIEKPSGQGAGQLTVGGWAQE